MKKFTGHFRYALLTEELFDEISGLAYAIPEYPKVMMDKIDFLEHPNIMTDVIIKSTDAGVMIDFPEQFAAEVEAVVAKHNPNGKTKTEKVIEKRIQARKKLAKKLDMADEELKEIFQWP